MATPQLLELLGPPIHDVEEETFLLFSQSIPSQNLGFVDPTATTLDITISGRDFTIHQSPTLLSSNRAGGTTGAVLWKITPLFAEWLASPDNLFFKAGALTPRSSALELGCGVSGLVGLAVSPRISSYVLTDQVYVSKMVEQNLAENKHLLRSPASKPPRKGNKLPPPSLGFTPLDWEADAVTAQSIPGLSADGSSSMSFDMVIACDCIYNDALVAPLVQTCADVCGLRGSSDTDADTAAEVRDRGPSVCVIAQQLRDPEIFEAWLRSFERLFRVWRVPDVALSEGLRSTSGFVVHVGILRDSSSAVATPPPTS